MSKKEENTVVKLPVEMIKTDEEYDKLDPDDPEIQSRARSLVRERQLQPILVNQDYKIVDGRRRLLATRIKGLPTIDAYVKVFESEIDEKIAELTANFERKHYSNLELHEMADNLFKLYEEKGEDYVTRGKSSESELLENPNTTIRRIAKKSKTRWYDERKHWEKLTPDLKKHAIELDISIERLKDVSMMSQEDQQYVADKISQPKYRFEWTKLFTERSSDLMRRVKLETGQYEEPAKMPAKKKESPKIDKRQPFNRSQLGNLTKFLQTAPFPDSRQGWVIGLRIAVNEKKKYFRIIFQLDSNTKLARQQEKSLKRLHDMFKDIKGYKGCYTIEPVSFDPQDGYWINETEKITPATKNPFFACTSKHESLF